MEGDAGGAVFALAVKRAARDQAVGVAFRAGRERGGVDAPHLELTVVAGGDAAALVGRDSHGPALAVMRDVRLDTVLRLEVPQLDQRIFAHAEQPAVSAPAQRAVLAAEELDLGDGVLVAAETVQADLRDQVPDDDMCVLRAARQTSAGTVERHGGHGRAVAIERDDDGGRLAVPQADGPVGVSDGEDVAVGFALRNARHFGLALGVSPPREQLALLDVPGEDLFVGGNHSLAGAGALSGDGGKAVGGPDGIGGARGDDTEGPEVLEAAVGGIVRELKLWVGGL